MVYFVGELLGKGSYGNVHAGRNELTGFEVALKFIDKSAVLKKPSHYERLRREVRILRLIKEKSPFLLSLHAVHETPTHLIIVTELLKGGELISPIKEGSFKEETFAREIFGQLVSAVHLLHEHGIIHRDIKPQNVLLSADKKRLKLVDFGFATIWSQDERQRSFCGSPYYASPEMVNGIPYKGPEVDIWSLGVILYSMISGGRLPFVDNTLKGLYARIATGRADPLPGISLALGDLISCMLSPDPSTRATITQVMMHPWLSLQDQQVSDPLRIIPQFPLSLKILTHVALLLQPAQAEAHLGRPSPAKLAWLARHIQEKPFGHAAKLYLLLGHRETDGTKMPDIAVCSTPSSSSSASLSCHQQEKKGIMRFLAERFGIMSSHFQYRRKYHNSHGSKPYSQVLPLGSDGTNCKGALGGHFVMLPEELEPLPMPQPPAINSILPIPMPTSSLVSRIV
ncbi:hypothetical protein MDAP_000404 [Mitosporidium daphniae]|uniref:Protein kinase domain-containing protein n=1 Tax=Mitosporidium daphniae TaxID=1485682 RepID=A0A098VVA8_9MICR|nr:uncharacterized protein DI09_134p20 [Mitosporidium daphniae]KGG52794.1 hypothetical protein DI09_134p20 [Mitosporidium daphniae]|eukprot:XP_013239230.1 uncharacterized protein DI09_134p20 [Mitosporidium daphniae]